jgi:hypothetical protein
MARNLIMDLHAHTTVKYLIRDCNSRYTASFDAVLADSDIMIAKTEIRIPRMNAIMKRWIRTCRAELPLASPVHAPRPSVQRPRSLRNRLDERDIAELITAYRNRATAASLAATPRHEPQQRQTPPTHRRCPPHPIHPRSHEGPTNRHVSIAGSCPAFTAHTAAEEYVVPVPVVMS